MVYINSNSGTITIPKHTNVLSESGYTLILTSNLSDDVVLVENGGNISTNSLYYKFALYSLNGLNVGEYTYTLYDDSEQVVEVGLLTYGNFERQVIVNNTFNREKIQYNPDTTSEHSGIMDNTLYYSFGQNVNEMLQSASTKTSADELQYIFRSTSHTDDSKFYVVYTLHGMRGKTPIEFTCGGCPMVMFQNNMKINGKTCVVWESGAIYSPDTELTVIGVNM